MRRRRLGALSTALAQTRLRVRTAAAVAILVAVPIASSVVLGHGAAVAPPHVLLVMEENQGYSAVIGNASAPYINSLAKSYASASAWYGIRHPSLPNYLAAVSGSTWGITTNCTTCGPFSGPSLGGQLSAAGVPWKAYMESMPSACYTGASSGAYVKRHNPFVYFSDVLGASCASHVVPFTSFSSDLAGGSAPAFAWVTPNLNDDMHDGTVQTGDTWVKNHIGPILSSPWFTQHPSTVIITMDERSGDSSGCCSTATGGHVPMVVISNKAKGAGVLTTPGDLYGTLRSIEKTYGLGLLKSGSNAVHGDLSAYFGGVTTPTPTPTMSPTATVTPTPTTSPTATATPSPSPTPGNTTFTDSIVKKQQVSHEVTTTRSADFRVDLTWSPKDKPMILSVAVENGATIRSVNGHDGVKGLHLLLTNLAPGRYVVTINNASDKTIIATTVVTHG